jgi:hypothetical protein
MEFEKEVPDFHQREEESKNLRVQYPNKLPTIIEPTASARNEFCIDQNK